MPTSLSVSAPTARRFLVLRHLLAPPRSLPADPESVMEVVGRLGSLQFDPLEVAGRNHDLVLLSRVSGYRRQWTDDLLYVGRRLFEAYNKGLSLLPTEELPWYRIAWDRARTRHEGGAFDEHAPLVEELLERIRSGGPLSSTDVEPRAAIDWYWRPTNQVRAILEALAEAGILGLARRDGNRRVYDLAERLFPTGLLSQRPAEDEQRRHKLLSRFRAHGLLPRTGGSAEIWLGTGRATARPDGAGGPTRAATLAELLERGELTPVAVDGIKGERLMLTVEVPVLEQAEREVATDEPPGGVDPAVAFLAPLDPLVWDRELLRRLWDFDYIWEVYVPQARRRWGYYVLPILYGDRLVGRIEPRIDRREGVLRVLDMWWEAGFDPGEPGFANAMGDALVAHARFADASRVTLSRSSRHAGLVGAVRGRVREQLGSPQAGGRRRSDPARPGAARPRAAAPGTACRDESTTAPAAPASAA